MAKQTADKPGKTTVQKPVKEPLHPVETLADDHGLPSWETAALVTATGWAQGKQVTEAEFESALTKFRNRPQGGGRI